MDGLSEAKALDLRMEWNWFGGSSHTKFVEGHMVGRWQFGALRCLDWQMPFSVMAVVYSTVNVLVSLHTLGHSVMLRYQE